MNHLLVVPNQYIVLFNEQRVSSTSVAAVATELARTAGGELLHIYDLAVSGFALKLPSAVAAANAFRLLQSDPRIGRIEFDRRLHLCSADGMGAFAE